MARRAVRMPGNPNVTQRPYRSESPGQVLRYLSRYTHRIAISNHRLVAFEDGLVTFRYKDRRANHQTRTHTLPAHTFLERFLQHVLPLGLVRIRHYGFLAGRTKGVKLERCRELIGMPPADDTTREPVEGGEDGSEATDRCPLCRGSLRRLEELPPRPELSVHEARRPP